MIETKIEHLSVGRNGQITVPVSFRKDHGIEGGSSLLAIRMGDALVLAPHDRVMESVFLRVEDAMKGAGVTVDDLKVQTGIERADIVQRRYSPTAPKRKRGR